MHTRKTLVLVSVVLFPFLVACALDAEQHGASEEELRLGGETIDGVGGVVLPAPDPRAQVRMETGRQAQLPVSWYYEGGRWSTTGLHVRTVCQGDADTGLLVRGRGLARFDDDSASAGGNGKGSYVSFAAPSRPVWERFTITAFSMDRATAFCRLETSTNGGGTWTLLTEDHFGGTTVDVGALRQDDFLEVRASASGGDDVGGAPESHYDTRMLLFDPFDETRSVLFDDDGGTLGINPRIDVPDATRTGGANWVLVGKKGRSTSSNLGVEVRVDLVHGPLDADYAQTALGGWSYLEPGRYYAWVHAKTSAPIGTTGGYYNPADALPTDWTCPSDNRGRLDGWAFRLNVDRWESGAAKPALSRRIRLAQMGARANEYNVFLLPIDVREAAYYRMGTTEADPTVTLFGYWRIRRNPDASELTAVTWNTLYDDGHNHHNKILNASNLLATRGTIHRTSLSIEEPRDQAPFQWDADVIGLTELREGNDDGHDMQHYAQLFRDEAERVGSTQWTYVWGRDEEYSFATDGAAPLFVASPFYPGTGDAGIHFSQAAKDAAGCEGSYGTMMCELDDSSGGSIGQGWWSIIGKVGIRRYGLGADRPITVVNLHLKSGAAFAERKYQLDQLIDTLEDLLAAEPGAFNRSGSTSPQHHQNRLVLLGDFNISAHHCGEHYWLLRRLREAFGYAIDASMYAGDWDGHDAVGSFDGWVPFEDYPGDPGYPWWLTTYRGDKPDGLRRTDRYDAIMLVGKGWAYDDPVVEYQVMNDRSDSTIMSPVGYAVEMWHSSDLVTNGLDSSGIARGYRPNYRLSLPPGIGSSSPFVPGEPALDSDHVPVRARLRVFQR